MWSIGNEIDYPHDPYTHPILSQEGIRQQHQWGHIPSNPDAGRLGEIAKNLAATVRKYDPSRAVTAGLAAPVMSNETDYPGVLDVVGYNYTERRYAEDHEKYPDRVFYGSENGHSMDAWKVVRDNDYVFGQFLWTGIEFLGESRPWPARGSRSGMLDLAGFKKPRAYFRQSLWSAEPMIYLGTGRDPFPLWNYQTGDTIRVTSYTNCQSARLFLNGRPIGTTREYDDETGIIFWDIPFEEGKLEAVGYNSGQEAARYSIETSSRPHSIKASLWSNTISSASGVAQVEIQIVDENGKPVFLSSNEITCRTEGPVKLLGLEAANPTDTGDYKTNRLRVYQGKMIAYIQSTGEKGTGMVTFTSPWLEGASVEIEFE
jgi:beta-galactosidase